MDTPSSSSSDEYIMRTRLHSSSSDEYIMRTRFLLLHQTNILCGHVFFFFIRRIYYADTSSSSSSDEYIMNDTFSSSSSDEYIMRTRLFLLHQTNILCGHVFFFFFIRRIYYADTFSVWLSFAINNNSCAIIQVIHLAMIIMDRCC